MSMWDLAGQPQYAAGLQPYIVSGSLYLLLVPALSVSELDAGYPDYLGRWLDYLQAGAPEAVVLPVVTHCDLLLPPLLAGQAVPTRSSHAFDDAASAQIEWVRSKISLHQSQQADGSKLLRVQEQVICVSCVAGGDASLASLRAKLEDLVTAKPPLLPSVGQMMPRTWLFAMAYIRALRDGRDPTNAARAAGDLPIRAEPSNAASSAAAAAKKDSGAGGGSEAG